MADTTTNQTTDVDEVNRDKFETGPLSLLTKACEENSQVVVEVAARLPLIVLSTPLSLFIGTHQLP